MYAKQLRITMLKDKIGIAIIGLGHWGPNYIKTFLKLSNVEIKWLCDTNIKSFKSISSLYSSYKFTQNINEVLNDEDVNSVIVATPASTHFEIIKSALLAKKNVLAEKPLTLDLEQASYLHELSLKAGKILMVGHTFLHNPAIHRIKDYINTGELGKIYYLNATRTHLGLIRKDVNVIWDLAPHDISIFNYLIGSMPVSVSTFGESHLGTGFEDVAFINLKYPGNIIANIHVSWEDSNKERTIRVVGSKARAVFDDLNNLEKVKLFEKGLGLTESNDANEPQQLILRDGSITSPLISTAEPLFIMCKHFVESVQSDDKTKYGCIEGLNNIKVMIAIQKSMNNNGAIEFI